MPRRENPRRHGRTPQLGGENAHTMPTPKLSRKENSSKGAKEIVVGAKYMSEPAQTQGAKRTQVRYDQYDNPCLFRRKREEGLGEPYNSVDTSHTSNPSRMYNSRGPRKSSVVGLKCTSRSLYGVGTHCTLRPTPTHAWHYMQTKTKRVRTSLPVSMGKHERVRQTVAV